MTDIKTKNMNCISCNKELEVSFMKYKTKDHFHNIGDEYGHFCRGGEYEKDKNQIICKDCIHERNMNELYNILPKIKYSWAKNDSQQLTKPGIPKYIAHLVAIELRACETNFLEEYFGSVDIGINEILNWFFREYFTPRYTGLEINKDSMHKIIGPYYIEDKYKFEQDNNKFIRALGSDYKDFSGSYLDFINELKALFEKKIVGLME